MVICVPCMDCTEHTCSTAITLNNVSGLLHGEDFLIYSLSSFLGCASNQLLIELFLMGQQNIDH